MKNYKEQISLRLNGRGCYIVDTFKGCTMCSVDRPNGCYDNCYANNIAQRYGYDFRKPIKRDFYRDEDQLYLFNLHDTRHEYKLVNAIKKIKMPFVRIGDMGEPSISWRHTIDVCRIIHDAGKPIVIITKHLTTIPAVMLDEITKLNIVINTSISALDDTLEIEHRLMQYHRLKEYCTSILRIVSCDFNLEHPIGLEKAMAQEQLFKNSGVIDTVFRPRHDNAFVVEKIINTTRVQFLKSNVMASVFNKNTYIGYCDTCPDMCGVK